MTLYKETNCKLFYFSFSDGKYYEAGSKYGDLIKILYKTPY